MEILVTDYGPEPRHLHGDIDPQSVDLDEVTQIQAILPIRYDWTVQLLGNQFLVKGSLEFDVSLDCARCGELFSTTLRDSAFLRAFEISETTDYVDLTPDVRDSVLLSLPNFPLCSAQCKGLCSMCATNLNQGSCTCEEPQAESAWSALEGLEIRQED